MKSSFLACLAFVVCAIIVVSCNKISVSAGTPKSIVKLIKKEKEHCLSQVQLYDYRGSLVYLFVNRNKCAGALDVLYSGSGSVICNPSDGTVVAPDYRCGDFYLKATLIDSIWSE